MYTYSGKLGNTELDLKTGRLLSILAAIVWYCYLGMAFYMIGPLGISDRLNRMSNSYVSVN